MHNHRNHLNLLFAAAGVFIVLAALGVPVLSYLPLLAVLAICPLMMVFMMRSMDHGGSEGAGPEDAERAGGVHRH
ncbi:MAG TPA: hypothetical protein DCS55_01005 [Acidimicrobiaceae bacterium]|jgi:hypothetical protein|nr:hypothetical protein [Acidimicrobiaceae bacterium]|tara:strand:+ start:76 stop:300 length:225 start_codon:yes stop_codon:yes gene_type:complete